MHAVVRQNFTMDTEKITATKKTLKVISITIEKTTVTGETQDKKFLKRLKNNPGDTHHQICKKDFRF